MIYKTIDTFCQFSDEFHRCGRGKQFSYEALEALYEYLEDLGEDYELDVVGLCCEFGEVKSYDEEFALYCDGGELEDHVIAYLEHSVLVMQS